ncbi:MAG: MFS transporter [Ignavibacteria bacterium]|nr:MFS transporter [Ignavibacteria bacterium]
MNKGKKKWLSANVINWSLFDFANSTFATIVVAFVFAVYFKKVVALNQPSGDLYWSLAINISMLVVGLLAPVLGAAADTYGNKKTFLIIFTLIAVSSTGLLYTVTEGMILWGMLLFILANIGFQGGLGFYDAFIKDITTEENYNKVSSFGYAVGYLGSLLSLLVVLLLKDEPRNTFIACALLYIIFALPLFIFVKEKKLNSAKNNLQHFITTGFKRISETIRNINKFTNIKLFLLSYFLYIDGVNTIIFFSANFAQTTLGFDISELILFFVIVQITALIGSFLFGWIADISGTKKTLLFIIFSWSVLTVIVYFIQSKTAFLVIGAFAGIFLGSSQALSRSFMSQITPNEKKTEFFGFYSLFEKTSTILGPLTFGLVSWLTGNQRYAALSIVSFFIGGYLILRSVEETKKPASSKELTG